MAPPFKFQNHAMMQVRNIAFSPFVHAGRDAHFSDNGVPMRRVILRRDTVKQKEVHMEKSWFGYIVASSRSRRAVYGLDSGFACARTGESDSRITATDKAAGEALVTGC